HAEQHADGGQDARRQHVPAPPAREREHEEGPAHRETEAAELGGRGSLHGLEERVDEGRDRRPLREHDQRAEEGEHEDDRPEPPLLAHAHEAPEFAKEGYGGGSSHDGPSASVTRAAPGVSSTSSRGWSPAGGPGLLGSEHESLDRAGWARRPPRKAVTKESQPDAPAAPRARPPPGLWSPRAPPQAVRRGQNRVTPPPAGRRHERDPARPSRFPSEEAICAPNSLLDLTSDTT